LRNRTGDRPVLGCRGSDPPHARTLPRSQVNEQERSTHADRSRQRLAASCSLLSWPLSDAQSLGSRFGAATS
ncbi:hypothetical protein ABTK91_20650, partial [Acinetobacter baumannii]